MATLSDQKSLWEKIKENFSIEGASKVLGVVFILITLIALIIILSQAYALKNAYEAGAAIQNECGDEFTERERGDYKVWEIYSKGDIKYNLEVGFKMLAGTVAAGAIAMGVLYVWYCIAYYKANTSTPKYVFPFELWNYSGDTIPRGWRPAWFGLGLALVASASYIASNFIRSLDSKYKDFKGNISPFNVTVDKLKTSKAQMYSAQTLQIAALFLIGLYLLGLILNNKDTELSKQILPIVGALLALFAVATIFIPVLSSIILEVKIPVDKYKQNYDTISITTKKVGSNVEIDSEEAAALKSNIYKITNPKEGGIIGVTLDINDPTLKSYVTHNVNYSDLQAIQIPDQLKKFIHYSSLKGESVLQLKRDLVTFYNDKNKQRYTRNSQPATRNGTDYRTYNIHVNNSNKTTPTYDESLRNTLFKHFTPEYRDILLNTGSLNDVDKINKKNDLIETINDYVIINTTFEKANPFSSATLTKLRKMRESTTIRDSVNHIYNLTSGLVFTTVAIALMALYRYMYSTFDNAATWISGIIIVLLFVGTAVGFLMKDTWF